VASAHRHTNKSPLPLLAGLATRPSVRFDDRTGPCEATGFLLFDDEIRAGVWAWPQREPETERRGVRKSRANVVFMRFESG
jgi:hypothetical protein